MFLAIASSTARADAITPSAPSGAPVVSWQVRCADRLAAARAAAARADPRLADAVVRPFVREVVGPHAWLARDAVVLTLDSPSLKVVVSEAPLAPTALRGGPPPAWRSVRDGREGLVLAGRDLPIGRFTAAVEECLALRDAAAPSRGPFAGTWGITGTTTADGCGGRVGLAARSITIDPTQRWLRVDVGEGPHFARVAGDRLEAAGAFPSEPFPDTCPGSRITEAWELHRANDGTLTGFFDSTWRFRGDCDRACTVRHRIVATRR